jgi:DNA-binding MarR family transcriptional regulator
MYPVDVTIYLEKVKPTLRDEGFQSLVLDEYGIEEFDSFVDLLEYEVEVASLESFNKNEDPMISEQEFISCLLRAVAQYHIDVLKEDGLLESVIDAEDGEIKYRLTDKGLSEAELIKASCN